MKKILLTILQISVTAFALWWVFKDPQKRHDMANALREADLRWIAASALVSTLAPIAAITRWGLLLRVQGIALSWLRVTQLYMVGTFFNLFLFGSTGGDAIKAFYLLLEPATRDKRARAIFAVLMDRLIGLMALIILSAGFVILRYHWLTSTPRSAALLASFVFIMANAVAGVVVTALVVKFKLADRLPAKMPGRAKILELAAAIQLYAGAWRTTLAGIGISLVGHSAFFFTTFFAAKAVHAKVSLLDISTLMPIVNTIVSLPISVSGVGVREGLFQDLLGNLCGVPGAQAVPISILSFLCSGVLFGAIGGVFYFFFRSATGAPAAPTSVAETDAMEAQMEERAEAVLHQPNVPSAPSGR